MQGIRLFDERCHRRPRGRLGSQPDQVQAAIEFNVNADGVAESLTLSQGDQEMNAPRVEEGS